MSASVTIPSRHGRDVEAARRESAGLKKLIPVDPEPTEAQWAAMGEALTRGDAPMDRLLDWMMKEGFSSTKPLFDHAATRGVATVPDAPAPLTEFFQHVEATPDWVDQNQLDEGARASAIAGLMGSYVLRDVALVGGYRLSAVNKTLISTGALEKGPAKRLVETTKWWIDCTRPGGMIKFGAGYISTLQVRLVHALVRRQVARKPGWDSTVDGVPVNQADLHITNLGFSIVYILFSGLLGVPLNPAEKQAIMDLWRYIGWLNGIEEQWLHQRPLDAIVALYQNSLAQPGPDQSSRILAGAMTDEPLAEEGGILVRLRGRWNKAVHLSIVRTFAGRGSMDILGLPASSPWYPILTAPPRFVLHKLARLLGARDWLVRRGARQQDNDFKTRAGSYRPAEFAPHMQAHAQGVANAA